MPRAELKSGGARFNEEGFLGVFGNVVNFLLVSADEACGSACFTRFPLRGILTMIGYLQGARAGNRRSVQAVSNRD